MKKKKLWIIAAVIFSLLLVSLAVPAVLAAGSENGTAEAAQTETTQQKKGHHASRTENNGPEDETSENMTGRKTHGHGSHEKPEEPEAPENAISKDAAKEIALTDAGFTAEQVEKVRCRLSDRSGTLVYKVSFKYDGQKYSYKIDPAAGAILDKTVSEANDHAGRCGHSGHGPAQSTEAPAVQRP